MTCLLPNSSGTQEIPPASLGMLADVITLRTIMAPAFPTLCLLYARESTCQQVNGVGDGPSKHIATPLREITCSLQVHKSVTHAGIYCAEEQQNSKECLKNVFNTEFHYINFNFIHNHTDSTTESQNKEAVHLGQKVRRWYC